jgi:hypothetical protein
MVGVGFFIAKGGHMVKKLGAALLAVLLTFSLTGCSGGDLPSGMEEDELLHVGRQVTVQLMSGEYEEVYDLLRDDQRELTTAEDIQALVLDQTDGAGVYKEIEKTMTTSYSSGGEDFGVAVLYCKFSQKDVLVRLAFDTDYALVGISVKRQ